MGGGDSAGLGRCQNNILVVSAEWRRVCAEFVCYAVEDMKIIRGVCCLFLLFPRSLHAATLIIENVMKLAKSGDNGVVSAVMVLIMMVLSRPNRICLF